MTPEQIEQWVKEAGMEDAVISNYQGQFLFVHRGKLEHFARLARADAFESSAMVADELAQAYGGVRESPIHTEFGRALSEAKAVGAHNAAVSISALAEREKEPRNGS